MNNNTHKTQKIFFGAITKKKLNELFHRASTSVMSVHINQRLASPLRATTVVNQGDVYCDIYVYYYEGTNKIGHFSIHYKMDDKSLPLLQRRHGRIHIRNNLNHTYYSMKCNTRKLNNADPSVLLYNKSYTYIRPKLNQCMDATLAVLNEYTEYNLNMSLDIPMTENGTNDHPCVALCVKNFGKTQLTKIQKTRKQSLQTKKLLNKIKATAIV